MTSKRSLSPMKKEYPAHNNVGTTGYGTAPRGTRIYIVWLYLCLVCTVLPVRDAPVRTPFLENHANKLNKLVNNRNPA